MTVSDSAIEGVSGALGGIVALTATYPLMTIATIQAVRKQQKPQENVLHSADNRAQTCTASPRSGKFADYVQICQEAGWKGLYAGIEPALLGTCVSQGVYFYLYSMLRQWAVSLQNQGRPAVAGRRQDISIAASLLTAALAGCGNVLLTNPIWVVATRMQAHRKAVVDRSTAQQQPDSGASSSSSKAIQNETPVRPLAVVREIYTDYGLLGFWKGVVPSLVMVSNPTVQYVLYEALIARRNKMNRRIKGAATKPSPWEIFALSALAKLGATVVTYPLLLVKTRMQTVRKGSGAEQQYRSTLEAVATVYRNEGILGFYRGMHTKMVQSVVAAALLFLIKEELTEATTTLLRGLPRKAIV